MNAIRIVACLPRKDVHRGAAGLLVPVLRVEAIVQTTKNAIDVRMHVHSEQHTCRLKSPGNDAYTSNQTFFSSLDGFAVKRMEVW